MRKYGWLCVFSLFVMVLSVGCFGVVQDDNSLSLTWTTGLVWAQTGPAEKGNESKLGIDVDEKFKEPIINKFLSDEVLTGSSE